MVTVSSASGLLPSLFMQVALCPSTLLYSSGTRNRRAVSHLVHDTRTSYAVCFLKSPPVNLVLNVLFSHMCCTYRFSCFCSFSFLLQSLSRACLLGNKMCFIYESLKLQGLLTLSSASVCPRIKVKEAVLQLPKIIGPCGAENLSLQALGLDLFKVSGLQGLAL